jgi:4-alpha-glucanotransferase
MPPRTQSIPADPVPAAAAARGPAPTPAPATWLTTRSAGVLAHVSSLPGEYGIGNLGRGARAFVDFLAESGVRYWQICPIGPTGFGDSPYQLFSASAGNPYFIDLGELVAGGLLTEEEVAPLRRLPAASVDYGWLYADFWRVAPTRSTVSARSAHSVATTGTGSSPMPTSWR